MIHWNFKRVEVTRVTSEDGSSWSTFRRSLVACPRDCWRGRAPVRGSATTSTWTRFPRPHHQCADQCVPPGSQASAASFIITQYRQVTSAVDWRHSHPICSVYISPARDIASLVQARRAPVVNASIHRAMRSPIVASAVSICVAVSRVSTVWSNNHVTDSHHMMWSHCLLLTFQLFAFHHTIFCCRKNQTLVNFRAYSEIISF